jgi:hypothetical protein
MPCLSCKRRGACRIRVPEVVGRFPIVPSWRHCISGCLEHACAPEMTSAETVFDMCRTTGWNNEGTRRCAVPGCHEFDPSDFMWNACPRMALPDSLTVGSDRPSVLLGSAVRKNMRQSATCHLSQFFAAVQLMRHPASIALAGQSAAPRYRDDWICPCGRHVLV